MDDGKDVRVVGLVPQFAHRVPGEELLRTLLMAKAGVNERSQNRELVGDERVARQELADVEPGRFCRNWRIGAAILGRRERLGVIGFQMACPADEPNQNDGRSFLLLSRTGFGAQPKQLRQRKAGDAGQPDAQKLAPRNGTHATGRIDIVWSFCHPAQARRECDGKVRQELLEHKRIAQR